MFDSVLIFMADSLKSEPSLTKCGREMLCIIVGKYGIRKSPRNCYVNAVVVVVNSLTRRNLSFSIDGCVQPELLAVDSDHRLVE